MLVIQRNGKTTVITGWRAWLVGAAAFIAATALLCVIVFLVVGFAVTLGAILLIVVPVAIGLAIIGSLFQPRPR